jgi:biopolymer transport protein ExbD
MAMSTGGTGEGPVAEINITPMIDVLLVLLIIFLVIQPSLQKGIIVDVPAVRQAEAREQPEQVVMRVGPGPSYFINGTSVERQEIAAALNAALEGRTERIVFVNGSEQITYGDVVHAMDAARTANIETLGLIPVPPGGIGVADEPGEVRLTNLRRMTDGGQNAEAYFSRTGERLIFQATMPGVTECDQQFTMGLDGQNLELVSTGVGRTTCGYFFDGGERIVYSSTHHVARCVRRRPTTPGLRLGAVRLRHLHRPSGRRRPDPHLQLPGLRR